MMLSICSWVEVLKHNQSQTAITNMQVKICYGNSRNLLNQLRNSKMTSIRATSPYQCTANSLNKHLSSSSNSRHHSSNNTPHRSSNLPLPISSSIPHSQVVQLLTILSTSSLKMIWMKKNGQESSKQIRITNRGKECSMRNRKRRTTSNSKDALRVKKH
jgi:hypothetical protein